MSVKKYQILLFILIRLDMRFRYLKDFLNIDQMIENNKTMCNDHKLRTKITDTLKVLFQ